MLEVKNLTKHYGDRRGVENISFTIQKGEIVGLLGPNGAGKSTFLKVLAGQIYRPRAAGQGRSPESGRRASRRFPAGPSSVSNYPMPSASRWCCGN